MLLGSYLLTSALEVRAGEWSKLLRTLGVMLVQLALLYTLPRVLTSMTDDGTLSGRVFYPLWWLLFLIPVGYQALTRWWPTGEDVRGAERAPELPFPRQFFWAVLGIARWELFFLRSFVR